MAQPYGSPCDEGGIRAQRAPVRRDLTLFERRLVLIACILASSMAFIDGSALTVAMPALRTQFGADFTRLQWVVNIYVLALAALTMIGGALADLYGKARILALGCLVFGVASIACALAPSLDALIAARLLQGVGAAMLTPASLALIGAIFPKEERNQAIGVWAAASALTTAGGPILGGWLTEHVGWEAIFWMNPPLAMVAVALIVFYAPRQERIKRAFDLPGAGLLAASLAAIAYALSAIGPGEAAAASEAAAAAEPSKVVAIAAAAIGVFGLIAYALWQRRARSPMTPPRLFANIEFTGLNAATLFIYIGLSVLFFVLPFELIDHRQLAPTDVGLLFLPFTLGVGLLSRSFGKMADRVGAKSMLIIGPLVASAALILMVLLRSASVTIGVIFPMGLLGLAFAILVAPLTASVMSSVEQSDEGLASGMNNTASRIAQLVGVALAAGLAGYVNGFAAALITAAAATIIGAAIIWRTMPAPSARETALTPPDL